MAFERTKSFFGIGGRQKRYPNTDDDYEQPQDVEDPHTTEDSGAMTLGEFISQNSLTIFASGLLLIIGLVVLAVYAGRYFITALTNPWFQRGLAGLSVAAVGYFWGRSTMQNALENRDEFIAYNPESGEVTRFLGEFRKANEGKHPLFVPIKGYTWFGHRAQTYKLKDLSHELATRHNRSPNEDVVFRLHPVVSATSSTNTGRKTVQLISELRPDPFGRESNVEATLPDIASRDTVGELKDELEAVNTELGKVEKENTMLRRQRRDAVKEAQAPREEIREEVKDVMEMIYPFASSRRGGHGDMTNGTGADMDEIREELTHNDDR